MIFKLFGMRSIRITHHHYRLLPFLIFTLIAAMSFAQRTVTGVVTDASSGETLIGANVFVKDTSAIGTVTDFDGNFMIEVPEGFNTVVISYTGYQSAEFDVTNTTVLTVALDAGELLEEVVVIGYGTIKREDATGSVQSVQSDDFNKGAITSAPELLAGKVPGVTIVTDGSPGGGATIRIRGESSLSATNDPLIVVDGVPIDNGATSGSRNVFDIINPNDIETFTVLKDASASAIYGNRAAGGVILITTKKGDYGQPLSIGYNGTASIGVPMGKVDVLSTEEFLTILDERYEPDHPAHALVRDASTDWQDEIYRNAFGTDHLLSLSGGIDELPYRLSLGYTSQEGILKTDRFQRFTTAVNLNPGFFENTLQLNFNFKAMFTQNNFADRGAIGAALLFDPTRSPYDESSPFGGYTYWAIPNGNPNDIAPRNPIALLEQREDESDVNRFLVNLAADYRLWFLPSLRANLNIGTDRSKGEGTVIVPTDAAFAFDAINGGGVNNWYRQKKENDLLEFYLNYKESFGRHDIDVVAGYSWQHFNVENSFRSSDAAGTPSETVENDDPAEFFLVSYYGRVNYGFNNRLLVTGTLRRDGTSRFSPDNRWGLFPAAAVAYKLLSNDNDWFNNLKIRAGWGITGQQDIGDYYAYLARYQVGQENARYQFGNEFVTTLRPNGYDESIQWEETETINLGLDFTVIKDRLSGALDVYQRNTTDLLNRIPVPAGTNLTNFVTTNVGNMENQGIELSLLGTPISNEKLSLDLGFNVAYNRNEITKLTATDDPTYQGILTGGIAGGVGSNIQIHSVGFAPRSFYVFEQMYDEDGNILEGQFVDRNEDGIINDDDKYRYQKPAADYTFGFNGKFNFFNFDFSFSGRANLGNYVYNNVKTDGGYLERLYLSNETLWNVHQSAVDLNVERQSNLTFSDHFVVPADFMKIDHMTLGYTFRDLIGKSLRVYFTAQNAIVVTKYDGLDPEIFGGIDNNTYPKPRTFLFGLNVQF